MRTEGIGEGGKAAIAAGKSGCGGGGAGGTGKGLGRSHFRTNLAKVLQVTSRTGDLEGSLEVLKYMSAMGVSGRLKCCSCIDVLAAGIDVVVVVVVVAGTMFAVFFAGSSVSRAHPASLLSPLGHTRPLGAESLSNITT